MDILKSLGHPEEIINLFKYKMGGCRTVMPKLDYESMSETLRTCYVYLNQTSRSFAAVIQALDGELRHAVCIFYLVLRALDTVEDDMTIPLEKKVPLLHEFHTFLYQPEWCFTESKEKDRQVLEDFPSISVEFRNLGQEYREVISDICHRMGFGMAEFLEKKVSSMKEWDKVKFILFTVYIPFVFICTVHIYMSNQFASRLEDFAQPQNLTSALACLNLLVTDALRHVPDVISYLSRLRNQSVFNFCAIPQVMAIATLSACYNNPQVFQGIVKIRKGQAVTLMMEATNMQTVQNIIAQYTQEILQKVSLSDPSRDKTLCILGVIQEKTLARTALSSRSHHLSPFYLSAAMLLAALSWQYLNAAQSTGSTDMQGS
uniref:Squalene synthase n=1 Tax=Astyanax mexicanus TaxID=7994 RepID=A0A8B9HC01_ASTMX